VAMRERLRAEAASSASGVAAASLGAPRFASGERVRRVVEVAPAIWPIASRSPAEGGGLAAAWALARATARVPAVKGVPPIAQGPNSRLLAKSGASRPSSDGVTVIAHAASAKDLAAARQTAPHATSACRLGCRSSAMRASTAAGSVSRAGVPWGIAAATEGAPPLSLPLLPLLRYHWRMRSTNASSALGGAPLPDGGEGTRGCMPPLGSGAGKTEGAAGKDEDGGDRGAGWKAGVRDGGTGE